MSEAVLSGWVGGMSMEDAGHRVKVGVLEVGQVEIGWSSHLGSGLGHSFWEDIEVVRRVGFTVGFTFDFRPDAARWGERGGEVVRTDVGQDWDRVVASFTVDFSGFWGPDASRRGEGAGEVLRADNGPDWDGVVASFTMVWICSFGSNAARGVSGSEGIGEPKTGGERRR